MNNTPKLAPHIADQVHAAAMSRGARCRECPLYGMRAGPVPSTVVRNAKLAIVGEAPGKNEILEKRNFTGASGHILNQSLDAGGLSRDDCTITNTIACRPPEDYVAYMAKLKIEWEKEMREFEEKKRDKPPAPLVMPAEACKPRLERDLAESNSRTMLAVGAQALKALASHLDLPYGKRRKGQGTAIVVKGIKDQHGSPIQLPNGRILTVSYHPAFAMRQSGRAYMPIIRADLTRAARIANRGYVDWRPPKSIIFPDVATIERVCANFVATQSKVVVDIETNGKDARKCSIRCIGMGSIVDGEEVVIVVPFRHRQTNESWWSNQEDKLRVVRAVASVLNECEIAGHNIVQFDSTALLRFGLISDRRKKYWDTMLMHKDTDQCDLPHKLEFVATRYLETPAWKIGHDDKFDPDTGAGTDEELHVYCGYDVANTLRILYKLLQRLAECGSMHQFEIDTELAPIFRDMGDLGLVIDVRRRRNLARILRDELLIRKREIFEILKNKDYFDVTSPESMERYEKIQRLVEEGPPKRQAAPKLTKTGKIKKESAKSKEKKGFNPNTPEHVGYFLFILKRLIPLVNTKGKDWKDGDKAAVGAGSLIRLVGHGVDKQTKDFIDALFVYRAYEKLCGTYVGRIAKKDLRKKIQGETRFIKEGELYGGFPMDEETWQYLGVEHRLSILHTIYKLQVIASGRVSTQPAIQNWPERAREAVCYECLGHPDDAMSPSFGRCKKCEKEKKAENAAWDGEIKHCKICHAKLCSTCKGKGQYFDKDTKTFDPFLVCKACHADGLSRTALNMRAMVMAPPGHSLVGADFDQLELRIYAAISRDQLILDVLADGRDPHMWNYACLEADTIDGAWQVYRKLDGMGGKNNKKVKELRNIAKRFVFLMIYGGEVDKLYSVMSQERDKSTGELSFPTVTDSDCRRWHRNWCRLHPWMTNWQNAMKRHAEVYGFAASLVDGRKRFFPAGASKANAPVNHPIQATGADFANRAIIELERLIPHRGWSIFSGLILQIHDCIVAVVPDDRVEEAKVLFEKAMNFVLNGVPITATATAGKYWSEV